jgi:predicted PurR-regulated permease PerM
MVDPPGDRASIFWIIFGMITCVSTIELIGVFLGSAFFAILMHVLHQLKPAGALGSAEKGNHENL